MHVVRHIGEFYAPNIHFMPCSQCLSELCPSFQVRVDSWGSDLYDGFRVLNEGDCCALCQLHQGCAAWTTYTHPANNPRVTCWLKFRAGLVIFDAADATAIHTSGFASR
jgi:hypothetical protein